MEQGEPTQFHNTHTTQPPFATFKTEIITCILAFKWDAAGITILRGNGGILTPENYEKEYEVAMEYISLSEHFHCWKDFEACQREQGVNYI